MIVAYSYVPVANEDVAAAFVEAMRVRSHHVEGFPGFRRFEFSKETGRNARYVVATWWDSMEDLRRYLASHEHRSSHDLLSEAARNGLGPPEVKIQEVIESVAVADG